MYTCADGAQPICGGGLGFHTHGEHFIIGNGEAHCGHDLTALHFHFHAQQYRNGDHAGPGMGDKNYAQNTRANCLVMTYINETTMNIDYYRHGYVVVDLGTVSLP